MDKFEIVVTTLLGIEGITANEIRKLGYETKTVEDGRVTFIGDFSAVCRANMWLRTCERVLIKIGEFSAFSFDELFEKTKKLPWSEWIPKNAAFPVKGYSLRSKLHSVPDCQSIIKKSIVDSLSQYYKISDFEENGALYQIEFSIMRDRVTLMIDTTGTALHKRGYRQNSNKAPLRETIAAAMVILSRFSYSGVFADPFCGSGTIPIEAGLIAKNIAPGLFRSFAAQSFRQISEKLWIDAKTEARDKIRKDSKLTILASDIDPFAVKLTSENSVKAKVSDLITVTQCDVKDFKNSETGGTIVCNPPYGERLLDEEQCREITRNMGKMYKNLDRWTLFALTPLEGFEEYFGINASKKRKIYNGMIKCDLYQYFPSKINIKNT